jgi:hypothetical protein
MHRASLRNRAETCRRFALTPVRVARSWERPLMPQQRRLDAFVSLVSNT